VAENSVTGDLLDLAGAGAEVTITAVLEGCETRLGVDRDEDGYRDRDELDQGSDPADPNSTPETISVGGGPEAFAGLLERAHPNPVWSSGTRIAYRLPAAGSVRLEVFDLQGRRVRVLAEGPHPAGRHEAVWDLRDGTGRRVAAGAYFVQIRTPREQAAQRVLVLD
jgi:hypothetical protein